MRRLGPLEAKVMDVVWSGGPVTVRQVHGVLQTTKSTAYTTVMTVMDNLHTKGMLTRDRDGRAYVYRAATDRESYTAELMADVLADSTDATATLLRFAAHLPANQADNLRQALDAHEGDTQR